PTVRAGPGGEERLTSRVVVGGVNPTAAPVVHVRGGGAAEGVANHRVERVLREVELKARLRECGLECLHLLGDHDRARSVFELEAGLLALGDARAALAGPGAGVGADAHAARVDGPAV